jgi:hypothetical protein
MGAMLLSREGRYKEGEGGEGGEEEIRVSLGEKELGFPSGEKELGFRSSAAEEALGYGGRPPAPFYFRPGNSLLLFFISVFLISAYFRKFPALFSPKFSLPFFPVSLSLSRFKYFFFYAREKICPN